jgi:predicted secreted protein
VINGAVHGAVLISAFAGFFFLSLFCLMPVGLGEVHPETGAPRSPQLGKKALIALVIAAVLSGIFYALIAFGILDL